MNKCYTKEPYCYSCLEPLGRPALGFGKYYIRCLCGKETVCFAIVDNRYKTGMKFLCADSTHHRLIDISVAFVPATFISNKIFNQVKDNINNLEVK